MFRQCESFFSVSLWDEGADINEAGDVTLLHNDPLCLEAEVIDGNRYHVSLRLNPFVMHCDCETANAGKHCVHMAAVCHVYEAMNQNLHKHNRTERTWYRNVKDLLDDEGRITHTRAFVDRLHHDLNQTVDSDMNHADAFDDVLDLYAFLLDTPMNATPWLRLVRACITQLSDIRTNALALSLDASGEMKSEAISAIVMDMAFLHIFDDYHYHEFDPNVLSLYFRETSDALLLADYINRVSYDHEQAYVSFVVSKLQKDANAQSALSTFCEQHRTSKEARKWLTDYYRQSGEWDKGIRFLEEYCFSDAAQSENITDEQTELFLFYAQVQNKTARDALFSRIMKNRHIDKVALFERMKAVMSNADWQDYGRMRMAEYMEQVSTQTQWELIVKTHSVDLLAERLLKQDVQTHTMEQYALLQAYDPGILGYFIALQLKAMLRQPIKPQMILTNLCEMCLQIPTDCKMLKWIIVQVKLETKRQDEIDVLEYLEDHLYETIIETNETSGCDYRHL